jgi:hypothetical protein
VFSSGIEKPARMRDQTSSYWGRVVLDGADLSTLLAEGCKACGNGAMRGPASGTSAGATN